MKDASIQMDKVTLGVCYYPEHWPREIWADDLRRMLAHGIEVVRVFEFAWNCFEPEEGVYAYGMFDDFLALAHAEGMKVILCTPTATPPAWLTQKHPEVLNADVYGHLLHHGHRRHYNYNAPVYHDYVRGIVTALAARYGDHPAVIGWQIDNEINCEVNVFYAQADRDAFRSYLQERFGTLDALNEAIGAAFWNQTYTDWAQVDLKQPTAGMEGNPHMALLEKQFISQSAIRFVQLQSDILRAYIGDRFITTNGLFGHLDSHEMTREALDFFCFDSYPNFAYGETGINAGATDMSDRMWSLNLSRVRSISPNFCVMEQQSGANGWDYRMLSPMPKPGQMRLWTFQSIAHGADLVSYFRWRTCGYGTEIYWHGLNDYGNGPNRRLEELMDIHRDVGRLQGVAGSRSWAQVALVCDYLNEWDGERDRWHGEVDRISRANVFIAAQRAHTPLDLLYVSYLDTVQARLPELLRYRMLIYPHATILTEGTAALLRAYCEAGGVLVMGCRTGYKDEFGRCPMRPMAGYAGELCGVEVTDYTLVRREETVSIRWDGEVMEAPVFHDILNPVAGGEAQAYYTGGYYDGSCAIVRKPYANGGAAYYVGSGLSVSIVDRLLASQGLREPFAGRVDCPEKVEIVCRQGPAGRFLFLLNYAGTEQTVAVGKGYTDLLGGDTAKESIRMPPYGVGVLREDVPDDAT